MQTSSRDLDRRQIYYTSIVQDQVGKMYNRSVMNKTFTSDWKDSATGHRPNQATPMLSKLFISIFYMTVLMS